jgi:hypothetical protein
MYFFNGGHNFNNKANEAWGEAGACFIIIAILLVAVNWIENAVYVGVNIFLYSVGVITYFCIVISGFYPISLLTICILQAIIYYILMILLELLSTHCITTSGIYLCGGDEHYFSYGHGFVGSVAVLIFMASTAIISLKLINIELCSFAGNAKFNTIYLYFRQAWRFIALPCIAVAIIISIKISIIYAIIACLIVVVIIYILLYNNKIDMIAKRLLGIQ